MAKTLFHNILLVITILFSTYEYVHLFTQVKDKLIGINCIAQNRGDLLLKENGHKHKKNVTNHLYILIHTRVVKIESLFCNCVTF